MARQKHRSQLGAIDKIDMTPLIDLTFLLLIVFMLTVPLLENGVDVSPPEMNSEPHPDDNAHYIDLSKQGNIVFNKTSMNREQLGRELEALFMRNRLAVILIRADSTRQYGEVMELMKLSKRAGFKNISLVTQVEPRNQK